MWPLAVCSSQQVVATRLSLENMMPMSHPSFTLATADKRVGTSTQALASVRLHFRTIHRCAAHSGSPIMPSSQIGYIKYCAASAQYIGVSWTWSTVASISITLWTYLENGLLVPDWVNILQCRHNGPHKVFQHRQSFRLIVWVYQSPQHNV